MDTKRLEATISFAGMIAIPVGVLPVVDSTEKRISFKTLHAPCMTPVVQPKRCPVCDVEVGSDDTVSGFKVGGSYIPVTAAEKESVAPDRSKVIELTKFVPGLPSETKLAAQDSHWLVPEPGVHGDHYAVLVEAMMRQGVLGMAMATLWGKQWPVVLEEEQGGLLLTKLWPARAVRGFDLVLPVSDEKHVMLMQSLVGEFTEDVAADDLTAPAHDALRELVEAKVAGREFTAPEVAVPEPTLDFEKALHASIAKAQAAKKKPKRKAKAA